MYWNFNGTHECRRLHRLAISNDGGTTFGAPKFVTNVAIYNQPLIRDAVVLPR
jgi:hypothetical protein